MARSRPFGNIRKLPERTLRVEQALMSIRDKGPTLGPTRSCSPRSKGRRLRYLKASERRDSEIADAIEQRMSNTKPEPALDDAELAIVGASAKQLLEHIQDKLVLDWRRKAASTAGVRKAIENARDDDLPADPYLPEVFNEKVAAIFGYVRTMQDSD